jgi:hypothetical protein
MAENIISALVSETNTTKFVRDCADPMAPPARRGRVTLEIMKFGDAPDDVIVNGVRFVREAGQ